MRTVSRADKWPFDRSGFRRGAKRCMGVPRGNGFLLVPRLARARVPVWVRAPRAQAFQEGWREGCSRRTGECVPPMAAVAWHGAIKRSPTAAPSGISSLTCGATTSQCVNADLEPGGVKLCNGIALSHPGTVSD